MQKFRAKLRSLVLLHPDCSGFICNETSLDVKLVSESKQKNRVDLETHRRFSFDSCSILESIDLVNNPAIKQQVANSYFSSS